jgi:hypothetical protein
MPVQERPNVAEGPIIHTDRSTVVACAIGSGLLALAAGVQLWDTWGHKEGEYLLPFHLAKDSLFTSFVVILCLVGGAGCLIAFTYKSLFPPQLIFGDEVLQVIRTGMLTRSVTAQVPYANIASVMCEREEYGFKQLRVGIDLHSPNAPGTYPSVQELRKKDETIRDLYLPGFLIGGPEEIARQIAARCRKNIPADGG